MRITVQATTSNQAGHSGILYHGTMHFGMAKGLLQKRINVTAHEDGIERTAATIEIKAKVRRLCARYCRTPCCVGTYRTAELRRVAHFLVVPAVHVKKITVSEVPKDYTASVEKIAKDGSEWRVHVAPAVINPKNGALPTMLRLKVDSDCPRLEEVSFFLMVDPDPTPNQR